MKQMGLFIFLMGWLGAFFAGAYCALVNAVGGYAAGHAGAFEVVYRALPDSVEIPAEKVWEVFERVRRLSLYEWGIYSGAEQAISLCALGIMGLTVALYFNRNARSRLGFWMALVGLGLFAIGMAYHWAIPFVLDESEMVFRSFPQPRDGVVLPSEVVEMLRKLRCELYFPSELAEQHARWGAAGVFWASVVMAVGGYLWKRGSAVKKK